MPQWRARMIAADLDFGGAPLLRRGFDLEGGHGDVTAARLHLSALGVCEAWLNGARVNEELLTPGWSSYEWRLRYRTVDVTPLLSSTSVLGVALGNGWYRGRLGWNGNSELYGDELAAWVQLEIEFEDGHTQTIVSDTSWQAGPSDVLHNDLYDGQTIDARLRGSSWLDPGPAPHLDRRPPGRVRRRQAHAVRRPGRGAPGGALPHQCLDLTERGDAGRLRPEPRRLGPRSRPRRARRHDHTCGMLRSSRTASSAPVRCAAPTRPTTSS